MTLSDAKETLPLLQKFLSLMAQYVTAMEDANQLITQLNEEYSTCLEDLERERTRRIQLENELSSLRR